MTLFEYLVVLLSIVLSLGVVRLLDGLPAALKPGRRDPLHVTWLFYVFLLHVQYWWVFWSYSRGVTWNYPAFLLALASPVLLYSMAITVSPRDAEGIASWGDHFWSKRARFFSLFAAWILSISLANWLVLGQPFFNRLRAGQGAWFVLLIVAALTDRVWFHRLLAIVTALAALVFMTTSFVEPAPLGS